jgi:hypothetical protein
MIIVLNKTQFKNKKLRKGFENMGVEVFKDQPASMGLVPIKTLKKLKMLYDLDNHQVLIEKDKIYFTIEKNEIFPVIRGLVSCVQRYWRRKIKI